MVPENVQIFICVILSRYFAIKIVKTLPSKQSMTERVPGNGVPTFCKKERNGTMAKERNEERNAVPSFEEREERAILGNF